MARSFRVFVVFALAVAAGSAVGLAQQPAPAAPAGAQGAGRGAAPPAGAPGAGRAGFAPVVIGPPAPVPPQVAIPRPTEAELAQINAALMKFVDTNTSPSKAVLQQYKSMILVQAPRANTAATYTQTQQRQGPRHEGFAAQAKQGGIDLVLEGDSITDFWQQTPEKKAMYDRYFGGYKTADFGISGDTTQGNLWGLHNGEGQGFQPKAVMLMIGTNNLGPAVTPLNTNAEIAEGVGAVVLELRHDFPNAKILLLAIFPRGLPTDPLRGRIAEINQTIAKLHDGEHVFYMDIGSKFLDDKGAFLPDSFQADLLHPQAKGYEIWGEAVKNTLAQWLK
jgi:beta-glucosidase